MTSVSPPGRRHRHRRPRSASPREAEIEQEIGSARARIGSTLDALACRLSPDRLLHRGSEMLSRYFGDAGPNRHLDRLGLSLIGAGIAAIVVANIGALRRRGAAEASRAEGDEEILGGDEDKSEGTGTARERGDSDRERPSEATNPLLVALLGFAAGAAIALLLPPGRRERCAVAEAREDLWRKAEAIGHELATRIRGVGQGAAAAQAQSAVREGDER